jgi:peptide/nickel transport system substrate-binding protein
MVFDTLYGVDGSFRATPQMVEGHTIEADGKLWTLTLRDGLLWHDGERVLASDCVASIRRWARRDPMGEALLSLTDELSASDDKTIRFRLKKPFALLPDALGKPSGPMCAMMPARLAAQDAFKPISDVVGSGPFRYVASERLQGARNVYARFEKYVPRADGTLGWTSGPKIAHFDRVEWTTLPDASTALAALQTGEQDWVERPSIDSLSVLKTARGVTVKTTDPTGTFELLRPNCLQPPFNNPAIRRALMAAINQADYMQAIVGDEPSSYLTGVGLFPPGTPFASNIALEPLNGDHDPALVRENLKKAGYAGETVVLLVPGDYANLKAIGEVAADVMRKCGMTVDHVVTDWGTLLQRRTKKGPVNEGGWSMLVSGSGAIDFLNPGVHLAARGNGNSPASWPGWCVSQRLEDLRQAWFDAPDLSAQKSVCAELQQQAMIDVPFYPLGAYSQPTAFRSDINGVLDGFATFWNVRRA